MKSLTSINVLITGDVMLDRYWFGDVNRISPEAPVPVVKIDKIEERLGGAANVARNVSSVGAKCGLIAITGKDEASLKIDELLELDNIENYIQKDSKLTTTIKIRVIGRQQQLIRLDFESEPGDSSLARALNRFEMLAKHQDVIILSDYGKGGLRDIERMIQISRDNMKPVMVDPKGKEFNRYRGATIITPNRDELFLATGITENDRELPKKMATICKRYDFEGVLLTLSEKGMTLFDKSGQKFHVPAQAQEVYDVSGAGDTVTAILATMIAAGESMIDAVRLANQAAGSVVAKLGTAVVTANDLLVKS